MNEPALEIWSVALTRTQAAVVEEVLKEDGYPADKDGLRDWILDGIKYRQPDVIVKAQRWIKDNPEKVDMARKAVVTLGRSIPFFLRSLRGTGGKKP